MSPKPTLDHFVILLSHADLLNPPAWITKNFTLTPGGRHGDGKTENQLILFRDGSYIELIAFVDDDPAHREGHWWGQKKLGIIDFALTTTEGDAKGHWEGLMSRLEKLGGGGGGGGGNDVKYVPPKAGSRKNPDGQVLKWEVTFAEGMRRGELPFFCHDTTPREWRVPITEKSTEHPCGAYGVKSLGFMVPKERAEALTRVYAAVLGVEPETVEELSTSLFTVGSVHEAEGKGAAPTLRLHVPTKEAAHGELDGKVHLGALVLGGVGGEGKEKTLHRLDDEMDMGMIMLDLEPADGSTAT